MKSVFQPTEIAPADEICLPASCCYLIKITPPQVAEGFVLWFYLSLLNRNRPVLAHNLIYIRVLAPIVFFCNRIPLRHCPFESNIRKPGAIIECIIADARYAVGDCNARKIFATREGTTTDACHAAVRRNDACFTTRNQSFRCRFNKAVAETMIF